MRVLVADADQALLEILQSFLRGRGHEVEMAGDGLECLSTLRSFAPDVLVLDRDLLWGGGDGVMAHMREDPSLADVPVIVVADEDTSDKPGGLRAGWLRKPFRLSDLLVCINSCTQQHRDDRGISRPRAGSNHLRQAVACYGLWRSSHEVHHHPGRRLDRWRQRDRLPEDGNDRTED